jgi:hypothetical protein
MTQQKKTKPSKFTPGVRTYRGSCHCGAYRFEADIDLGKGTTQCNCTSCSKSGWWGVHIKPEAFRRLAPAELKAGPARPALGRVRCETCGIVPYGHGELEVLGGEFYSLNVRCLDDVDFEGLRIHYLDGLNDTWALLSESPYVNPFVDAGGAGLRPYIPPTLERAS